LNFNLAGAQVRVLNGAPIVGRQNTAMRRVREQLHDEIEQHKFWQFLFFKQWFVRKTYCNERGLKLIDDA